MSNALKLALVGLTLSTAACNVNTTASDRQAAQTQVATNEADRRVGMPAITNYAEKLFAKEVYEDRDTAVTTFVYLQGMDGRLTCLGAAIGYGIPYGVQFTAPTHPQMVHVPDPDYPNNLPTKVTENLEQPEPNGLYMPASANATWIKMIDPATRKAHAVYLEPNATVSPFRLTGPAIAAACPR